MNEFIVWDTFNAAFMEESRFLAKSHFLDNISKTMAAGNHLTFHNYIGKTDIDGNKIYADSSIVEVKLKDYDSLVFSPNKFIGYFSYNEITLRYLFHADDKIHGWGADFLNHLEYIKIIGTLQENKELL